MFKNLVKQEKVVDKKQIKNIQSIKIEKTKNPFKSIANTFNDEKEPDSKLNLFQKIKTITHKLTPLSKEELGSDMYIMNRFLSMNKEHLPIISLLTKYLFTLKPHDYYLLLYGTLPRSTKFVRYQKKNKLKIDMYLKKLLKKEFCCNNIELEEIVGILYSQGHTEKSLKELFGLK